MRITSLRVVDFCCFNEFELSLDNLGLVCINGLNSDTSSAVSNGSGKSTIFKALTWGLFGKTVDGERGDKVIRSGQKKALVEVVLSGVEGSWKVVRERKKGAPHLSVVQPNGEFVKLQKDALQLLVDKLLGGLNFQAFKNSVLYGQNDTARFSHPDVADVDRKAILNKVLGIDVLAVCLEIVKSEKAKLEANRFSLENRIGIIGTKISSLDIRHLKDMVDRFEEERIAAADSLLLKAEGYKSDSVRLLKSIPTAIVGEDDLNIAIEEKKKLEALLKELDDKIDGEKHSHNLGCDNLNESFHSIRRIIAIKETELKSIRRQLQDLSGERCPTCNSLLGAGEAQKHVNLLLSLEKEIVSRISNCNEQLSSLEDEKTRLDSQRDKIASNAKKRLLLIQKIDSVRINISSIEKKKSEYKLAKQSTVSKSETFLALAKEAMKSRKAKLRGENPYSSLVQEAKDKKRKYKRELKSLIEERNALDFELSHIEYWNKGFSNQGLPSYMIDFAMPYITDRANEYLKILSDGDITVCFSTQRELKSAKGEYRDQIEMSWSVEGIDDSYPPSGGQLKKMEIAVDLALMDLVASRGDGDIGILMMDEVLDGLDSEGRNRVVKLLQELRQHRGTILVITHEPDLSEYFEKSITVSKKDGIAELEVN